MKNRIKIIVILLLAGWSATAQSEAERVKEFNLDKKVAISGYDPVAYFKQNKAVKEKRIGSGLSGRDLQFCKRFG